MSTGKPYGLWLKENIVEFDKIPEAKKLPALMDDPIAAMKAFGYTREDLKAIIKPMAEEGKEPIGSMGNDTPLAALSKNPKLLYDYFKQLFAQVTNPPIDSIREEVVMSLQAYLGPEKNILEETPGHCHKIRVKNPIVTDKEFARLKDIASHGFKAKTISILFAKGDENDFFDVIEGICKDSVAAVAEGYSFIVLSDRGINKDLAALPALLAVGTVHQRLVKLGLRTQISILVESGEPRETHHLALLFGYGADCINPYMAYEAINYLAAEGDIQIEPGKAVLNYIHAAEKGILKILSKMGISTLQSYRGAQIFEALGVSGEVINKCFTGTVSRIGGIDFKIIRKEVLLSHRQAYPANGIEFPYLSAGGLYQCRKQGEFHLWNPDSISVFQDAVRNNNYGRYKEFSQLINDQANNPATLRGILQFKPAAPISLEQVESEKEIFKRFVTGAMSFGSISKGAHETMAIAMNRLGGRSNTGEGGEDPARFIKLPDGDSLRSSVKQVASGRFGVTTNYLVNADEIQIKIAQGAKPGEGGQLPGHKVSAIIAKTRYTTTGVTLISPPPHHDIYSIEDLAQLIFDLKNVNPNARVSVKLVSEIGVGTVAAGVAKGHADMILISGGDGGTGASPLSSIRHAGLPWELGLAETHQTLILNDLRSRVRLQTDGQMRTGRDVAIAAILGAEEYGFATAALIAMGCVMLRHCHLNNCALGIATQDDILQKRFAGKPEYLTNYFYFVARELREIMAQLGASDINSLIGKTEFLETNEKIIPWKAHKIDLSKILYKPKVAGNIGTYCQKAQDHGIDKVLDKELIELADKAIKDAAPIKIELPISNTNRTTGAMLSGRICRQWGENGLAPDTIRCKFKGTAGQSFGAWLARGVTMELEGMANDYVGKGISGGTIIIYPDKKSTFTPEENIIIGNTAFYGAIAGQAYIKGVAGERFCIRNSGLTAVVEGVGDHGCEYMTGGRVVILGKTGINFAAGMSGGIAYIYDGDGTFKNKCNREMVDLEKINEEDTVSIKELLDKHIAYTDSRNARAILDNFGACAHKFIKIMPHEYKKILEQQKAVETVGAVTAADMTEDTEG
jgi:glutamate synthase domain-containing protein 2/glutamate synthase domain-containing protein 3